MPKTYHTLTENQRSCLRVAVGLGSVNPRKHHHMTIQSLERAGLQRWTPLHGGSYQATEAGVKIMQLESTI